MPADAPAHGLPANPRHFGEIPGQCFVRETGPEVFKRQGPFEIIIKLWETELRDKERECDTCSLSDSSMFIPFGIQVNLVILWVGN